MLALLVKSYPAALEPFTPVEGDQIKLSYAEAPVNVANADGTPSHVVNAFELSVNAGGAITVTTTGVGKL